MHQKNDPIPTYKHKAFSCASKGYVYIYICLAKKNNQSKHKHGFAKQVFNCKPKNKTSCKQVS